ncbi:MAG: sensor histidine kinase [archaeon]
MTSHTIVTAYLIFGITWIFVSDRLVLLLADSSSTVALVQTFKGWVFVLLSAMIFFSLTRIRERQLEESRDRAQSATQQLQVLNRVFRHNIRNDLNVIKGYTDLVRESSDDYEVREMLGMASRRAAALVETSEKFQIITDVEIDDNLTASVDLGLLTREEIARFRDRYPGVTVDTDLPEHRRISGGVGTRYVIREILTNAVEHYPGPESDCEITVTSDVSFTTVTLRFADNGSGIPQGEMEVLETGESSELIHSDGVGLWLITWICEYYGGEVEFSESETGGAVVETTFLLENPLGNIVHRDRTPLTR